MWKGAPVLAMAGNTVTGHTFCPGTQETSFAPTKLLTLWTAPLLQPKSLVSR